MGWAGRPLECPGRNRRCWSPDDWWCSSDWTTGTSWELTKNQWIMFKYVNDSWYDTFNQSANTLLTTFWKILWKKLYLMYCRTNQIGFLDSFVDQCLLICRPSYSHLFKNFCIHLGLPEHVLLSTLSRKCVGHAQWWVVPEEWLTGWARHRCEHSPLLSLQLLIPTNVQAQLSTTCTYKLDISTSFIS